MLVTLMRSTSNSSLGDSDFFAKLRFHFFVCSFGVFFCVCFWFLAYFGVFVVLDVFGVLVCRYRWVSCFFFLAGFEDGRYIFFFEDV